MTLASTLRIALAAGLLLAPAAAAFDDCNHDACRAFRMAMARAQARAYDPETGRDLLIYPRHRLVDHQHMKLVIDIPDMNTPQADVVQTLTVNAIGTPVEKLILDAKLLDIRSITSPGRDVQFEYDNQRLSLTFSPPLQPGAPADIITTYTLTDPTDGLFWTPESPSWPGRSAQIHTQGQPESNRSWFPSHDFPNERLTTELVVTVPAGYLVSSNGRLVEHTKGSGRNARETFHWLQDKPHVNYLVSLIIGKFDVVDVAELGPAGRNALRPAKPVPMPVYVPPGRGPDVAHTYGRTAEMVGLFERLVDEAYPWDRYAQLVVWNFGAGGMENTSATTMYDTAILSKDSLGDGDLDGLIAHELAHQWFGDLITCKSWEHIWLNEGFATYFSTLWFEHRDGKDAYWADIVNHFDGPRGSDRAEAPGQAAMLRKRYNDPWEVFGGPNNPYPRGASILHMLRQRLGDELFFRGLATYVDRFKSREVETDDLRRVLEEVSGESLEQFFRQWCYRPGMPDLDVTVEWDAAASEVVLTVKQTQNIDGYNPAYEFDLPVELVVESGRGKPVSRTEAVQVRGKEAVARFASKGEPSIVAVDPRMTVLSRMAIKQPAGRWVAQALRGPTLASRVQAVRALGEANSAAGAQVLKRLAGDSALHAGLRVEAINALKTMSNADAILELAQRTVEPSDVRLALIERASELAQGDQVAEPTRSALKELLVRHASGDSSGRTRAAALRGLGRLKATDELKLVLAALETPSQHDRVRQAALDALAEMDAPGTLTAAARFALPGTLSRTRPTAISAVQRLAHHDPDAAYKVLAVVLKDRERRAWEAAAGALAQLGDERAAADLERLLAVKADPADQAKIRRWMDELKAKAAARAAR